MHLKHDVNKDAVVGRMPAAAPSFREGKRVMRKVLVALLAVAFLSAGVAIAEENKAPADKKEEVPVDKISYSVGYESGKNFRMNQIDIDFDVFMQGFRAGLEGRKPTMSEKEIRKVLALFRADIRRKMAANRKEAITLNKAKEAEYLAENKKKPGVTVLPSGLQYIVVKEGKGKKATEMDFIVHNYRGTLIDGTEWDKTDEGKPETTKVSQLIPGWKEAAKLMPEGSRWQLVIPSKLGYGERNAGTDIPPNSTLLLDLEILQVKSKARE